MTVWFITGASRGLGAAIAEQALLRGDHVAATARRPETIPSDEQGDRLLPIALDVTQEQQAEQAVAAATSRFGRIDVLVNNAGTSLFGAVEEASAAEVESVFASNLYGALNVARAVLPVLRAQRSGTVVNIGSMGGFAQSPGWGVYGATKFALEGISEAMAGELAPLGIHVMIVEPGSFRTDFLDAGSLRGTRTTIDDYAATVGVVRAATSARHQNQINDPVKGAAAIVQAVTAANPPTRLQIGPDAVAAVERKLAHVHRELQTWRPVSESTLY